MISFGDPDRKAIDRAENSSSALTVTSKPGPQVECMRMTRPLNFKKHRMIWSASILAILVCGVGRASDSANWWVTTSDKSMLLAKQATALPFAITAPSEFPTLTVDPTRHYQGIDGFGFALTGGSAEHLIRLPAAQRSALLKELFSPEGDGIGISYLRVSIGASDLNDRVFSYDDLPPGQTDVPLARFTLSDDLSNVVPVLKEILALNPTIKILGSPWSAPTWMKTNGTIQGGKLKPEFYSVYAKYFVRYIQAMAGEGIPIDAITIQNEPFNDGNTPSMQMFAKEQAEFIKHHLGPQFRAAGINTKIILYDHNCDAPEFPVSILTDPEADKFVAGSGFHLYAGQTSAMTKVHDYFPAKDIYFTEMMAVDRRGFNISNPVSRILIGATRNWSRNVILWNLAANAKFEPHTDNGGCAMCQGAITLEGGRVERNLAYYVIGHASKFVPPGSVRIESTWDAALPNVAFRTPTGGFVLIVANASEASRKFNVSCDGTSAPVELVAGAVATFVW